MGASTEGLAAAVKSADLGRPEVLAAIPARVRELASAGKEPRATAVMLRALSAAKHGEAAALACELLDKLPTGLAARGNDTELLVDATLLAVANGPGTCADAVKKRLGEDRCVQSLRCGKDGARLGIGATTDQREPLCSAEDLKNEVARDLARPKAETLEDKPAYATERLALAALRAMNAVPEDMERAHARRQYAVKQPEKPECGMGVALGAPCRCDEAALRDQVCRNDTTTIAFSFCRAEVSDAKKEIGSVVMSSPP